MPEIYADWKSLKPLTAPVPVGAKCVVIGNANCHGFKKGQIVTRTNDCESRILADTYSDDGNYWWITLLDIAILPADYKAEPKAEPAKPERKVVQIAANPLGVVALCSDVAIWGYSNVCGDWNKLPPIPQD